MLILDNWEYSLPLCLPILLIFCYCLFPSLLIGRRKICFPLSLCTIPLQLLVFFILCPLIFCAPFEVGGSVPAPCRAVRTTPGSLLQAQCYSCGDHRFLFFLPSCVPPPPPYFWAIQPNVRADWP